MCKIYHLAFYTNRSLRYVYSKYHLINQVYALPAWALKPYLSYTGCGKGRAGKAVSSKISRKKGKSNKKSSTGVFNITTASI